jgi:hypothetical protein
LRGSSGRKLNSSVSMMEPAKDGMRNNVSEPPDVEQRGDIFRPGWEQQPPRGAI